RVDWELRVMGDNYNNGISAVARLSWRSGPAVMDLENNRWICRSGVLIAIADPLQQKSDHCSR
ncbi:hypothetical protein HAX54_050347, partial [Datura stramonium]|nr:hypothetical protein [Datura stramonium]